VYTYLTPDVHAWQFGIDGATTFPTLTVPISDNATPSGTGQTIKFGDSSQQAIIFGPEALSPGSPSAQRVIIQGAPGYTGTAGEGGDVYVWAGPGGSTDGNGGDIKVRAGQGDGTGGGGYLNFQAGDSGTGNGGWINIESGQSNTYGNGGDITVQAHDGGEIFLRTHNSITTQTWTLGATGTTTFPGALVKSTVAKTGVADLNANDMSFEVTAVDGSGVVTEVTITNTPNIAWQSNGAGTGVTVGDLSFTVQVDGSGNATVSGITSSGGHSIGETFTTGGDSFGAEILPTAIDLTKSVNKLTSGLYTLANGVEGQIMYLVGQTGAISTEIGVVVANYRVNGSENTGGLLLPFRVYDYSDESYYDSFSNICTLIFTDGAWQQSGGAWD
jgi:hypothetical protein